LASAIKPFEQLPYHPVSKCTDTVAIA